MTLGVAAAFGLLVALLLVFGRGNRAANRWLAAVVIIVVLRMMPYVIGYAGFYDAYPWLSYAPFEVSLALGPLLWFHVWRLTGPDLPPRWWMHLIPGIVQFAYRCVIFVQPLAWKNAWDSNVHVTSIEPAESLFALVSLGFYIWLAAQRYRTYQRWLVTNVSDRDEHRQPWLRNTLIAMGITLFVTAGFESYERLIATLTYFDRFPLYLFFSALVVYLGLEGWRHAAHRFPAMVDFAEPALSLPRDWSAEGREWADRIDQERWWAEPQLSLAEVARRLGTNQSYVSRALNDGLGVNFNSLINKMRVAHVQRVIRTAAVGHDLLSIALDAGFSSKASFNRAFREHSGVTPSAFRTSQMQ